MLTFFPTPYPDEILYSTFARYHLRSGNTSPKITMKELFGDMSLTAVMDLPSNINNLISNMPVGSTFTKEELIYNHTVYPYYEPFLPKYRAEQVIGSMESEYGGNIHSRLGIMASSIKANHYFKFCPKCNEEDKKGFGELYWHRLFQVPGVYVCTKHDAILQDSQVHIHGFNKHEYITAIEENCTYNLIENVFDNRTYENLLAIARDIEYIICNKQENRDSDWFQERYSSMLIKKGLASASGRVYQQTFAEEFVNFYGKETLKFLQSEINPDTQHNWLSSIVRKHRKAYHPVRHLLLVRFLCGSIEEFFENNHKFKPFGTGPWPCLNRAADHYHRDVINTLEITHDSDTKQPVGTFYCSCGFVFSRRGPDESEDDRYRFGRIKQYGGTWENKLRELVALGSYSLRELARQLNVDVKTVKRYVEKLNLMKIEDKNYEIDTKNFGGNTEISIREAYRSKWLELRNIHKELKRTELRKLSPATYTWLYRHDKEWLDNNSPTMTEKVSNTLKVDWQKRDKEILTAVKSQVNEILIATGKPERITIGRLGRLLGISSILDKHIDKLPETNSYLSRVVEGLGNYQIRRAKWAINELIKECEELKTWKVLRKAGISKNCSAEVLSEIEKQIQINDEIINNLNKAE